MGTTCEEARKKYADKYQEIKNFWLDGFLSTKDKNKLVRIAKTMLAHARLMEKGGGSK